MLNKHERSFIKENINKLSLDEIARKLGIHPKKLKKEMANLNLKSKEGALSETPAKKESISVSSKNRKKIVGLCIIIFLVTFGVYYNTLGNDFIWDDEYLILNNSQIKSFSHLPNAFTTYLGYGSENVNNFYRPLQEISNMADYFLWGEDPRGFHLTNILLHALATVLVFIFIYYICGNTTVAFITGILFGVHPIHTEAVSYIAGRADSLYSVFFLQSFIFFIRFTDHAIKRDKEPVLLYLSNAFFILSLLSKEISLVLPILIVLYIYMFLKDSVSREIYDGLKYAWVSYAALLCIYALLRLTVLNFFKIAPPTALSSIPFLNRILTFFKAVLVYLALLAVPAGLHMERTLAVTKSLAEGDSLLALLAVLAIVGGGIIFYKRNRIVSFFIFWFFINLLPVSNIFPINSFIAEHWLYMASVGYFFILSVIIYGIYRKTGKRASLKAVVILFLLILTGFYSAITVRRNMDWKDEITFFESTLRHAPRNARLYLNLGNTYFEKRQYDKAIEQYKKAIEFRKDDAAAYSNMGSAYVSKGNLEEGEKNLKKAIALQSNLPIAHYALGRIYRARGKITEAVSEFEICAQQLPQYYNAWNELGEIYLQQGNKEKAKTCFQKSLGIMPNQPRLISLINRENL